MAKRLLLLGGGHAHLSVLHALARGRWAGTEVALVTPFERQLYSGMLPGVVAGHYRLDDAAIPLRSLAEAGGVRFIEGTVSALDATQRRATLSDGRVAEYDLLSLDTGGGMDRSRLPGAREHGLFVRPLEHFARLLEGLWDLAAQRVLDVVVVGGGAAGVELALALEHRLSGRGEERARVALVTGGPEPLAGYPAKVVARGCAALARRRIAVFREACAAIEPGSLRLASGARLACDAPIIATGTEAPPWLADSGLAQDERGFVATGATLQSRSHPEVFAVGDVATRTDLQLPRSGVQAVRAGPALALNLQRLLGGAELQPHRPSARTLNLISCGRRHAIMAWGRWSAEGRWVWWWKDRIDRGFIRRQRHLPKAP